SDAAFWCDQSSTAEIETCEQIIDLAFTRALDELSKQLGGSPQSWTWGKAHIAVSEHRPMSKVSWLKRHFEVSRPMPGDGFTINVGFMDLGNSHNPYAVTKAASMRAIYDLADLDKSQFIYQTGQSGWINSRNYSNYANTWAKHEYLPLTMNPSSITHTSVLKPDPNRVIEPLKKKPENRVPDRKR
ncbi:MAG: hypothetical protein EBW87_05730, partial [Burkholderiaceae bacterium]|nr:hypothetical protein [Burkholderiaceae bacterium]